MESAAADVDDPDTEETRANEEVRDLPSIARVNRRTPRDAEADGEPLLRGVQPALPARPSSARQRHEAPARRKGAGGPRDEAGPLARRHEIQDVDQGRLRERARGSRIHPAHLEPACRGSRKPAARAVDLARVRIETEIRPREAGAGEEMREQAGPAPEIHERAARLEDA